MFRCIQGLVLRQINVALECWFVHMHTDKNPCSFRWISETNKVFENWKSYRHCLDSELNKMASMAVNTFFEWLSKFKNYRHLTPNTWGSVEFVKHFMSGTSNLYANFQVRGFTFAFWYNSIVEPDKLLRFHKIGDLCDSGHSLYLILGYSSENL